MQSKEIRFLGQSCGLLSPEQGIQLGWWLPVNILLLFFFSSQLKYHGPREITPELSLGQGGNAPQGAGLVHF